MNNFKQGHLFRHLIFPLAAPYSGGGASQRSLEARDGRDFPPDGGVRLHFFAGHDRPHVARHHGAVATGQLEGRLRGTGFP